MLPPVRLPAAPGWISEFKSFVMRGNVVDLAVGIVIGAAFTAIVNSLVKDLITPVLGLVLGGIDFTNLFITMKGPNQPTLDAAKAAGAVTLNVGLFLNAIISFLIVSFAIFWVVRVLQRFVRKEEAAAPAPTTVETTLTEIRDLLAQQAITARSPIV